MWTVILELQFNLYGTTHGLTLTLGRKRANLITLKAKEAHDALFIQYSTIIGDNILKLIPNAQSLIDVGIKKIA